jgi:hypothetical protein
MLLDDPMVRQTTVAREAGSYKGESKYGKRGNMPPKR